MAASRDGSEPVDVRGSSPRLLAGQDSEIEEVLSILGLWLNTTAFVREAVNEKLERAWLHIERKQISGDDAPGEGGRPRGVQDVARRTR